MKVDELTKKRVSRFPYWPSREEYLAEADLESHLRIFMIRNKKIRTGMILLPLSLFAFSLMLYFINPLWMSYESPGLLGFIQTLTSWLLIFIPTAVLIANIGSVIRNIKYRAQISKAMSIRGENG